MAHQDDAPEDGQKEVGFSGRFPEGDLPEKFPRLLHLEDDAETKTEVILCPHSAASHRNPIELDEPDRHAVRTLNVNAATIAHCESGTAAAGVSATKQSVAKNGGVGHVVGHPRSTHVSVGIHGILVEAAEITN